LVSPQRQTIAFQRRNRMSQFSRQSRCIVFSNCMHADAEDFRGCRKQGQTFAPPSNELARSGVRSSTCGIDQNEPAVPWVRQHLVDLSFARSENAATMLRSEWFPVG